MSRYVKGLVLSSALAIIAVTCGLLLVFPLGQEYAWWFVGAGLLLLGFDIGAMLGEAGK
jgi:hypothetical protein